MTTGPENAKKVIRQVEYYFGDSNMQRDKFLQDEVAKDAEGWVPLTTMLKVKLKGQPISVLKPKLSSLAFELIVVNLCPKKVEMA